MWTKSRGAAFKQARKYSPSAFVRRKLYRTAVKLNIIPADLKSGEIDGGAYQTQPGCRIHPDNYIDVVPENDALWTQTSGGQGWGRHPTHAKCGGCYMEIELVNGRIPEHTPGPPPFTQCPMCGRPYEGGVGVYTEVICNECARNIDAKAYLEGRGDLEGNVLLEGVNDWESGNWLAPHPDKTVRGYMAKARYGHTDTMNAWTPLADGTDWSPDQYGGIPL